MAHGDSSKTLQLELRKSRPFAEREVRTQPICI